MEVVQPDKVRPVLNVSSPKGDSFNSMVDENETEAVKMVEEMNVHVQALNLSHK